MTLQEGIYYRSGSRPGAFFAVVLLRTEPECSRRQLLRAMTRLWDHYAGLRRGELPQLPGHRVPDGDLTVLIGYGIKLFDRPDVTVAAPPDLEFGRFRSTEASGGGLVLSGSGLRYAADVTRNPATEDIVVQFIGNSQLAVTRAVVETWRVVGRGATEPRPLHFCTFFTGYQRDDRRSWLDFHDGVSNLASADRLGAIEIESPGDPAFEWTAGGTYLTFMRVAIDLDVWSDVPRARQERLVGRDILSGASLTSVVDGRNIPVAGCPVVGTTEVTQAGNEAFREPPITVDPTIASSHVQRSNHHVPNPADPSSLRIFRQGYEFLEPSSTAPGFHAGLNFVSFTDTPQRLSRLLTTENWLGATNFGGRTRRSSPAIGQLLTVRAAGTYIVPPQRAGERFPGDHILGG